MWPERQEGHDGPKGRRAGRAGQKRPEELPQRNYRLQVKHGQKGLVGQKELEGQAKARKEAEKG